MELERTLVLIKPDAIQRDLVGNIITRLEHKGLKLVGIKMAMLSDSLLDDHYAHLRHRPFFSELKTFMQNTPVIVCCWEGVDCVQTVRLLCGATKAREAEPGTIRGDSAMSIQLNLIHASDSLENAQAEIRRFFLPHELFSYVDILEYFIYSTQDIGPKERK